MRLIASEYFDAFILVVIFSNCVILAICDYSQLDSYGNPDPTNSIANKIYHYSVIPFIIIYSLECVIKVIAMGFVGVSGSYLSNWWNWVDFIVVITG